MFGVSVLGLMFIILAISVFVVRAGTNPSADGSLRIEPLSAYNFVVDSNVLTPATYGPSAATLAAKFCNDSAVNLTNVSAYIGNYNGGVSSTPGVYPTRSTADGDWTLHPQLSAANGGPGTYSLTHEGGSAGTADATRFIGTILPGECKVQYWIVSYPTTSINGAKSVAGGNGPDDDLFLFYDFWVKGVKSGSPVTADLRKRVNFRNEISAMANKIWPNTTSKVPGDYLTLIGETLGWNTLEPGGGNGLPGTYFRTQGIWYDLGVVGAGFDNDGDLVPDRNAWVQPVGDANTFDAGCFRLVRTYGILVIKRSSGDMLVPFENQLYFTQVPEDNTGAVGLVYYEYVSLDGVCTGTLTPYQEVASGYDNEKFNGDFGYSIPPLQSTEPEVGIAKSVDKGSIASLNQDLTYTIQFSSPATATAAVGLMAYNMPLVVHDTIPSGTVYLAGSASGFNTPPVGLTYNIWYSTDHGLTWVSTEPIPASGVTDIEWWLSDALPIGASGTVKYAVNAPTSLTGALVENIAHLQFGTGDSFAQDNAITLLPGSNSISGFVYEDNGAGGGILGDKIKNTGEAGVTAVSVSLYLDTNDDGSGDVWISTLPSGAGGAYSFPALPDGKYIVVVNDSDTDLTTGRTGWTNTNPLIQLVDLDSAHSVSGETTVSNVNFGFAPVLTLTKTKLAPTTPAEGGYITYTLKVKNSLPAGGSNGICVYSVYGSALDTTNSGTGPEQFIHGCSEPCDERGSGPDLCDG